MMDPKAINEQDAGSSGCTFLDVQDFNGSMQVPNQRDFVTSAGSTGKNDPLSPFALLKFWMTAKNKLKS